MFRHRLRGALVALAACPLALACAPPAGPKAARRPPPATSRAPTAPPPADEGINGDGPVAWVSACEPDTPAHRDALKALDHLDEQVSRLGPADDPKPALAAIREVLAGGCFRLSAGDEPDLSADSGHALKAWWFDGGGRWWASHYLELTKPRGENDFPSSVVAPTIRTTLARETRPGHPLAALLCGVDEPACAAETAGFRERAEYAFRRFADTKRAAWLDSDRESPPPDGLAICAGKAQAAPAPGRYEVWRECLRGSTRASARLPLGAMRAPRRGWLVVQGRRGHYAFCDEVRAYDLATGSAYVASSCSGLALRPDGSVNGRRTDDGRRRETRAGTVAPEALREAAWMALLAPDVQPDVAEAWGFALPQGVEPKVPENGTLRGFGSSFSVSSGQTRLAFHYVVDGVAIASGQLTWPEDLNDAAHEHAVQLLRFAESTLRPGCPSAPLPKVLAAGAARSAVSPLDASPGARAEVERELFATLAGARRPACGAARR